MRRVGLVALLVLACVLGAYAMDQKQAPPRNCFVDKGALAFGQVAALNAGDLYEARKILLSSLDIAGYRCKTSPTGVWSCEN